MSMCKAVEDYVNELVEQSVKMSMAEIVNNLLKKGFDLAEALEIADIDEETYRQYSEKV